MSRGATRYRPRAQNPVHGSPQSCGFPRLLPCSVRSLTHYSRFQNFGRADRTRTCNNSFWRRGLYQLSYRPMAGRHPTAPLLRLFVIDVLAAMPTILRKLKTIGCFLFVFLRIVITTFALSACHYNHHTIFFFCHVFFSIPSMKKTNPGSVPARMVPRGLASTQVTLVRPPRLERGTSALGVPCSIHI